MKLQEIIKYNGAIFLTGLFFIFISATAGGSLLLHKDPAVGPFLITTGLMLIGGAIGMNVIKGYLPPASFVPDYFILTLPVTGLLLLFGSILEAGNLSAFYALTWGFSLGACIGLLLRSNPDPRASGYPSFALGCFAGSLLSIMVMTGKWYWYDVFAVLAATIAFMPVICFADNLKSRRGVIVTILLGAVVCMATIPQAIKMRSIENDFRMLREEPVSTPRTDELEEQDITSILPALLQNKAPRMKVMISEPATSGLGQKIARLPFVDRVVRTSNSKVYHFNQPDAVHSGLRRMFTNISYNRYMDEKNPVPDFDAVIIITESPLSERDNRFHTREFYQLTAGFLQNDGIIITSAATLRQAATMIGTMKEIFPNFLCFPARSAGEIFIVASKKPLENNFDELDRRAYERFEHLGFCRGMMGMLIPPARVNSLQKSMAKMSTAQVNSDLYPVYLDQMIFRQLRDSRWQYLPWALLVIYLLCRFLLTRKQERRISFNSFENGFYCGGFILMTLFICQAIEGQLYLYLGGMCAIFIIGTACGFSLQPEQGIMRLAVSLGSIGIPFTLLCYNHIVYQEFYLPILGANMFMTGIFGGSAIAIAAAGMERGTYRDYLGWLLSGLPAGIAICWFVLTTGQSLLGCILLMAATRLPLLLLPWKIRPHEAKTSLL